MESEPSSPIEQERTPAHFEFLQIQDEEKRQELESKYKLKLDNLAESINGLRRSFIIENNGIDEDSQNFLSSSMSYIYQDIESLSRDNVAGLEEIAEKLARVFNAIEYTGGVARPEYISPMISRYRDICEALDDLCKFLKELDQVQPTDSLSDTFADINRIIDIADEEYMRTQKRLNLAEEYYNRDKRW